MKATTKSSGEVNRPSQFVDTPARDAGLTSEDLLSELFRSHEANGKLMTRSQILWQRIWTECSPALGILWTLLDKVFACMWRMSTLLYWLMGWPVMVLCSVLVVAQIIALIYTIPSNTFLAFVCETKFLRIGDYFCLNHQLPSPTD